MYCSTVQSVQHGICHFRKLLWLEFWCQAILWNPNWTSYTYLYEKYLWIFHAIFYLFCRAADLPIDPYWGAVILAVYRLILAFLALSFAKKLPRRLTYITCMGLTSLATSMIGTFFYLQTQDNIFFRENIYIRMMPLIGIIVLYFCTTFATLYIPGLSAYYLQLFYRLFT